MGEVNITIGGRTFRIGCGDGEEAHLQLLAGHLAIHVENLRKQLGKVGDDQLFMMAGLMVCDELWDCRDQLSRLEAALEAGKRAATQSVAPQTQPAPSPAPATGSASTASPVSTSSQPPAPQPQAAPPQAVQPQPPQPAMSGQASANPAPPPPSTPNTEEDGGGI